ncbi:MAG: hypothetical protein PHX30_05105 [Candidatus Pacebacteria bacterium]|jgi:hypothetical protein|nr:hypothetical protein [Candidatus Paceibacterota bacterium]
MKNKKLIIISLALLTIAIIVLYIDFDRQRRQDSLGVSYEEYTNDDPLSLAVEEFGQDRFARHNDQKSLCAAKALWEKDVDSIHKVVLSSVFCMEFTIKDGELEADDGYIDPSVLFMIEKKEDNWQVTDYDDRNSEEAPAKSWVSEYDTQIPSDINTKIDKQFVWSKLMSKASKVLNVKTPTYTYNACSYDSDCDSGETCALHNLIQNEAANKCVKECSSHEECGAGYLCRTSCVNGENKCNFNSKNVCKPFFEMNIQSFNVPDKPF